MNAARSALEAEEQLRHIWAALLDIDPASIMHDSDFFLLGGNSMLLLALQVAIDRVWGLAPAHRELLENTRFHPMLRFLQGYKPGI